MSLTFSVQRFAAWAPQITSHEAWREYLQHGILSEKAQKPDLSFIPAIQRRRLSPLARAVFYVTHQVSQDIGNCPSVYCSQYGESQRTYGILEGVANEQEVSPAAFSLSVHNAISGQSGIYFDNKHPAIALGTHEQGYLNAFVDALGLLNEGHEHILMAFYEEEQPVFYDTQSNASEFPCAIALLISKAQAHTQNFALSLNNRNEFTAEGAQILSLIRFFITASNTLQLGPWQIEKSL